MADGGWGGGGGENEQTQHRFYNRNLLPKCDDIILSVQGTTESWTDRKLHHIVICVPIGNRMFIFVIYSIESGPCPAVGR